jgi:large subunit ribosomal protein L10
LFFIGCQAWEAIDGYQAWPRAIGQATDTPGNISSKEEDMAKAEKIAKVDEIRQMFLDHQVIFLTDFSGLNVEEINNLRFQLRDLGAEYRVLKNTLTLLAIRDTDYEEMSRLLAGPVAAAFCTDDPMAVAKELVAFVRSNQKLDIKGGFMEGRVLEAADVRSLALLPSREVLLAKVSGALKSPLYGLHNVLSGPCRKLVYALQAVADSKSEAA